MAWMLVNARVLLNNVLSTCYLSYAGGRIIWLYSNRYAPPLGHNSVFKVISVSLECQVY